MKINTLKYKIDYNDIFKFNAIACQNTNNILRHDDWYNLWTNKIDYFEYQLSQCGKKYPLIRESFSYFIGLAENSIYLFNITNKKNLNLVLSHKRIKYNESSYDFYNPLNYIIDFRVRDICEYFKDSFFYNENIYEEIEKYLYYNDMNYDECCLFSSRLLYPSYYFDLYEK